MSWWVHFFYYFVSFNKKRIENKQKTITRFYLFLDITCM